MPNQFLYCIIGWSHLQQPKVGNQTLCNTIPKPWSSDTLQDTHLWNILGHFISLYLNPNPLTVEAIYACHITTFMVSSCQCDAIRISFWGSISMSTDKLLLDSFILTWLWVKVAMSGFPMNNVLDQRNHPIHTISTLMIRSMGPSLSGTQPCITMNIYEVSGRSPPTSKSFRRS